MSRNCLDNIDVVEVQSGNDDGLLWLSLGFVSVNDPRDVLHVACSQRLMGDAGSDALYLERTDQDLACNGEVRALHVDKTGLLLALSAVGAQALALPEHVRFTFDQEPHLYLEATAQLALMAAAGHACIVDCGVNEDTAGERWPSPRNDE